MKTRIGILAGAGTLPLRLLEACRASGRDVFVLAFENHADPALVAGVPHAWVRLGAAGTAIRLMREADVGEVIFAGSVGRPSFADLRPDGRALRFLASGLLAGGDDALLKGIVRTLEQEEGFRVIGAQTLLAGDLATPGPMGAIAPDESAETDIDRGVAVVRAIGAADLGQAVVVQQGIILGVEAVEGTDALLARAGPLKRNGPGGVLVKLPKPKQELRVDIPVIGPGTVARAAAASLRGIAVAAGATLVLDRAATITAADRAGLFLVGIADPV